MTDTRKIAEDALRAELLRQSESIYFWDPADVELFAEGPADVRDMTDTRTGAPARVNDRFDLGAAAEAVLTAVGVKL